WRAWLPTPAADTTPAMATSAVGMTSWRFTARAPLGGGQRIPEEHKGEYRETDSVGTEPCCALVESDAMEPEQDHGGREEERLPSRTERCDRKHASILSCRSAAVVAASSVRARPPYSCQQREPVGRRGIEPRTIGLKVR